MQALQERKSKNVPFHQNYDSIPGTHHASLFRYLLMLTISIAAIRNMTPYEISKRGYSSHF